MTVLQPSDLDRFVAAGTVSVPPEFPPKVRQFYSPIDDVHGALKVVIGSVQHSLIVAMFGFDDDELAGLIDVYLKNPNVFVQVSLDRSQAGGVHEKALLDKYAAEMEGNSVAVAIGTSEKSAIMHRKMVIVDGRVLVTGSTNWSHSGETKQDNELTVSFDPSMCTRARTILDLEHQKMLKARAKAASTQ